MQPEKTLWGQPIRRRNIKQIQILGILYPNVPWSCRPYQQFNRYHLCRWHHRTYRRWRIGRKHSLQQCISSLSDRKQRWQELELPVVPLLERSSAGRTRVSLECSDFEKQRENSGKQDGEENWILEYDSPSDNDDIPSLEREADFTSEEVPASEEVFAWRAELCSVNLFLSPLLWNYKIAVTFCVLSTVCIWFSFLWYWPTYTHTFFCDRSLMKESRYRD